MRVAAPSGISSIVTSKYQLPRVTTVNAKKKSLWLANVLSNFETGISKRTKSNTYSVSLWSYSSPCHQSQPNDLRTPWAAVHDRVVPIEPSSVLVPDITNQVLVCQPNRHLHQIPVGMVHADLVRPICIDSHLYWTDAPMDNRAPVVLRWLWYRNLDGLFCRWVLDRRPVFFAYLVGLLLN